ncbi:MAG: hypothetical protein HQL72_12990 [Magnetococcales bacterium]|nr:hypothetical protein [Magnetococcales bacterium]
MKNAPANQELYDIVRGLLISMRVLTAKTATAIINGMEVDEAIAGLGSDKIMELEEYELELLLSPLFTPTDDDRAACESALPPEGIDTDAVCHLQKQLCRANLSCQVMYGVDVGSLMIPNIVVERFVRLLGLSSPVEKGVAELLESVVAVDDRHRAFSLARRPVWRNSQNSRVLAVCLEKMAQKKSFSAEKMDFLTSFVRTYRPKEPESLVDRLNNMVEAYNRDKDHPVYNRNLAKKQENSLMPLSCNKEVRAARISMADALLADFAMASS